ncbi:MAG: Hpt domain-containing protein [bacterium]|nr:Hpt domain-containing protein [bacterium]
MDSCECGSIFDRAELLQRTSGDAALAEQLITLFLAEAPPLVQALQHAGAQHAFAAAHTAAHTLKGMAATLAAPALRTAAAAAEHAAAARLELPLVQAGEHVQREWAALLQFLTATPHHEYSDRG